MHNQLFLEAIVAIVQISVHGRFYHKLETLATATLNSLIHEHLLAHPLSTTTTTTI